LYMSPADGRTALLACSSNGLLDPARLKAAS
jgi:hypothetical protein